MRNQGKVLSGAAAQGEIVMIDTKLVRGFFESPPSICDLKQSDIDGFFEQIHDSCNEVDRLNTALTGAKHIADSAGQTIKELRKEVGRLNAELTAMTANRDNWKRRAEAAISDMKAMADMTEDAELCEFCRYGGEECTNPKDLQEGDACFEWRGNTGKCGTGIVSVCEGTGGSAEGGSDG